MRTSKKLTTLLKSEDIDVTQINGFFSENLNEKELLSHVLNTDKNKRSTGQIIADKVAEFGGSWTFIISFFAILVVWILINSLVLANKAFDPYPFILLNLVLSCLAAIQAPIIMMSQNRQEQKDRERSEQDYLINLKAEIEIRNLQTNMQKLFDVQAHQIALLEKILEKRA